MEKDARSRIMSSITSKNTKPELIIRRLLWSNGIRYRLHIKGIPGKPDIVFKKKKIVVFINGCFWHNHICICGRIPRTNSEFWKTKIETNVLRDEKNYAKLSEMGWKVLVLWECEINRDPIGQVSFIKNELSNQRIL